MSPIAKTVLQPLRFLSWLGLSNELPLGSNPPEGDFQGVRNHERLAGILNQFSNVSHDPCVA